ncbi:uncharacterized protein [Centruroides vittatus]|uniref:uncharacterized protein n=1 Tax=Centruroides vittatus TaxID=120091 RepID=UPI003510209E
MRYLGIIFDRALSWKEHINKIHQRMLEKSNTLMQISRNVWGLNYRSGRLIYRAAIEPAILYRVQVWGESANKVETKRKLRSIQRKFMINICKAYRTAPTDALLVLANILPIDLRIKQLVWEWSLIKEDVNSLNSKEIEDKIKKGKLPSDIGELIQKIKENQLEKATKNMDTIRHPAEEISYKADIEQTHNNQEEQWKIFTDGSKNAEGSGAGVVIYDPKNFKTYQASLKMAKHCTITQAELWAVFKALQHVDNKLQNFKGPIKVYTNSRVVIHTLKNQKGRTQLANELIGLAQKLGKNKIIKFQWIPGHKGNEGNEKADKLAKRAALKNLPTTYKRIPLNIIKNKIKEIVEQQWQEEWEHSTTGRTLYRFIPTTNNKQT